MAWTAKAASRVRRWLGATLAYHQRLQGALPDAATEIGLKLRWVELAASGAALPSLRALSEIPVADCFVHPRTA